MRCKAFTQKREQCTREARINGYCTLHFKQIFGGKKWKS